MTLKELELGLQLVRLPQVVCVEECDVLATRHLNPAVSGGGGASVRLVHIGYAIGEGAKHVAGLVDRTVVDNEHLEVGACLRQCALDRLRHPPSRIVRRDDDAYRWIMRRRAHALGFAATRRTRGARG